MENMKKTLREDKELLDLQNEYSKLYKTRLDIIIEGKTDPTYVEDKLKEAYTTYCSYRDKYFDVIKEMLDMELD
jgi:hypothetical protein